MFKLFIYFFFERVCEEFISFAKLSHSFRALFGGVERDFAAHRYIFCCGDIQSPQYAGGAEQAESERVGLLFGFRFFVKFLMLPIFYQLNMVAEEDVTKLVGNSEARNFHRIFIIKYDVPFFAVIIGLGVFGRCKVVYVAVFYYLDAGCTRYFYNVNGYSVNFEVEQTFPSTISDFLINTVVHKLSEWFVRFRCILKLSRELCTLLGILVGVIFFGLSCGINRGCISDNFAELYYA